MVIVKIKVAKIAGLYLLAVSLRPFGLFAGNNINITSSYLSCSKQDFAFEKRMPIQMSYSTVRQRPSKVLNDSNGNYVINK